MTSGGKREFSSRSTVSQKEKLLQRIGPLPKGLYPMAGFPWTVWDRWSTAVGCPVCWGVFNSIPGPYLLDARGIPRPHNYDNWWCHRALLNVPWGQTAWYILALLFKEKSLHYILLLLGREMKREKGRRKGRREGRKAGRNCTQTDETKPEQIRTKPSHQSL